MLDPDVICATPDEINESVALRRLIVESARFGKNGRAFDFANNEVAWTVEADTKVDETDEFFPVIVHWHRSPG